MIFTLDQFFPSDPIARPFRSRQPGLSRHGGRASPVAAAGPPRSRRLGLPSQAPRPQGGSSRKASFFESALRPPSPKGRNSTLIACWPWWGLSVYYSYEPPPLTPSTNNRLGLFPHHQPYGIPPPTPVRAFPRQQPLGIPPPTTVRDSPTNNRKGFPHRQP